MPHNNIRWTVEYWQSQWADDSSFVLSAQVYDFFQAQCLYIEPNEYY